MNCFWICFLPMHPLYNVHSFHSRTLRRFFLKKDLCWQQRREKLRESGRELLHLTSNCEEKSCLGVWPALSATPHQEWRKKRQLPSWGLYQTLTPANTGEATTCLYSHFVFFHGPTNILTTFMTKNNWTTLFFMLYSMYNNWEKKVLRRKFFI